MRFYCGGVNRRYIRETKEKSCHLSQLVFRARGFNQKGLHGRGFITHYHNVRDQWSTNIGFSMAGTVMISEEQGDQCLT